jgi:hypothetical protein
MKGRRLLDKWSLAAVLFAICIYAGCASKSDRGRVAGTLQTRDGTPLKRASVIATASETGKTANGTTDQAGYFELGTVVNGDGVLAGNYNIGIVEDRGDQDNRRPPTIAARYRDPASSGIKLTINAGESKELNLKLDPP